MCRRILISAAGPQIPSEIPNRAMRSQASHQLTIRKCLYCLNDYLHSRKRKDSHFTAEHVVHDGLTGGISGNNPTLIGIVCQRCNAYLGENLDQRFLRSGYVGRLRYEAGQKCPSLFFRVRFKKPGNGIPVKTVVRDGKLLSEFVYACALHMPEGTVYLTEEQIELGDVPQIGSAEVRFQMLCNPDEEPRVLEKLKSYYKMVDGTTSQWTIGTTPVFGQGQMGEIELRCIAKIGFNYLAWLCDQAFKARELVFDSGFNEIRTFIRFGAAPSFIPVSLENHDAGPTSGLVEPPDRTIHQIELRIDSQNIYCLVNLFNCISWRVFLTHKIANSVALSPRQHIWDLKKEAVIRSDVERRRQKSRIILRATERS